MATFCILLPGPWFGRDPETSTLLLPRAEEGAGGGMEKQCHQWQHSQIAGEASGLHRAGL